MVCEVLSAAPWSPGVAVLLLPTLLLLVSWSTGCASGAPTVSVIDDRYSLESLEFPGATRFTKSFLIDHLYSDESSVLPLLSNAPFDQALIQADADRLQRLYQAYGYFDAVVTAEPPLLDPQARTASVRFVIKEGQPTLVQSVRFIWEGVDQALLEKDTVRKEVRLETGAAFEMSRYNASLGALSTRLKSLGYPLAQVLGQTRIDRDARRAHTVFRLLPGPRATVGTVRFEGLVSVPQRPLDVEVQFARGRRYSPLLMREMEDALRGLGVFSWVAIKPPEQVNQGEVDLVVQVSEADPQSVRLGAEVSIDTVRWQEQVRADYTHTNLFGRLTRLDLRTTVGWAQLPDSLDPELQGPVLDLRPQFTKKGLLEDHLMWSETPQFTMGLNQGYQYYSWRNRLGVSRWFPYRVRLGLEHDVNYVDFFNLTPSLDPLTSVLGLDFRDPLLAQRPLFFGLLVPGGFGHRPHQWRHLSGHTRSLWQAAWQRVRLLQDGAHEHLLFENRPVVSDRLQAARRLDSALWQPGQRAL